MFIRGGGREENLSHLRGLRSSRARAARATKSTIDFGREREQKRVLTVNEESAYCENRE